MSGLVFTSKINLPARGTTIDECRKYLRRQNFAQVEGGLDFLDLLDTFLSREKYQGWVPGQRPGMTKKLNFFQFRITE
jgi:hypothetical protein